jgi:hypothetical protein
MDKWARAALLLVVEVDVLRAAQRQVTVAPTDEVRRLIREELERRDAAPEGERRAGA